jgi:hypothetical protein
MVRVFAGENSNREMVYLTSMHLLKVSTECPTPSEAHLTVCGERRTANRER